MEKTAKQIRLLLVEDDPDFGAATNMRLSKRRFDVTLARTAEEALPQIENTDFDVVVVDIKLPGMQGMQFTKEIRKRSEDLPVLILTGYGTLETAQEAVKLNVADYLLKPLETLDDLLGPVEKAAYSYRLVRENRRLVEDLKAKIEALEKSEKKYKSTASKLERRTIALQEVVETGNKRLRDNIVANVKDVLLPAVAKLRRKAACGQEGHLKLIEKNLKKITASFACMPSEQRLSLSSREAEICNMIAGELSTGEIAAALNISTYTVQRHRNTIRKKLGIVGRKINLATYLREG